MDDTRQIPTRVQATLRQGTSEQAPVPRLAPWLERVRVGQDLTYLLGDREHSVVHGQPLAEVLEFADGRRTKADVILHAARRVGFALARRAFKQLEVGGYLRYARPSSSSSELAFWHTLGVDDAQALDRVRGCEVRVRGRDAALIGETESALRGAGFAIAGQHPRLSTSSTTASRALDVWLVDDYLDESLEAINREHLEHRTPWMMLNPLQAIPFIGPLFHPGRGPCWECLAYRLRSNRPLREHVRHSGKRPRGVGLPPAHVAASRQITLGHAALALGRHVATQLRSDLEDHLFTIEHATGAISRRPITQRPQCPACGNPSLMSEGMMRPVMLQPVKKRRPHIGGYRKEDACDTYERFKALIDPHVGVVTFVSPRERNQGRTTPVFVSGYTVPLTDGARATDCKRVCAGKGRTLSQAKASALCEALERKSGVFQGDEARLRATAAELGERAFSPAVLNAYSERQYRERNSADGETLDPALWIPEPLPPDVAIDWAPAWSLTHECRRYVPFTYCFANCPPTCGTSYCQPCGNGVAAGTCREEALLQALLELIERDALAIWWYNRIPRQPVEPQSLAPELLALLSDYRSTGSEAWLLDLTHDLNIPVYAAIARRDWQGRCVFSFGFGCHLDPNLAAERALTELHQLGDGINPGTGKPYVDITPLSELEFLVPRPTNLVTHGAMPTFDGDHLGRDVEHCVALLRNKGLEVLVVDKTRPDIDLPVVQVIVPGLRHMRPRFAPGRLYDVPVQMGWLDCALREDALNPVPLVL